MELLLYRERSQQGLTLGSPSSASSVPPHWHGLLVTDNILQVCDCASQLPSVDGLSCLARVFERYPKVGTASAGRLGRWDLCRCVANLVTRDRGKTLYSLHPDLIILREVLRLTIMVSGSIRCGDMTSRDLSSGILSVREVRNVQ